MDLIAERDRKLLWEKANGEEKAYQQLLTRLENHEPLAYLLEEAVFYDETYRVTPACLIPRPDTERLVEEAIHRIPEGGVFADLCTGSGCVAISILAHRPDLSAFATDISEDALALAAENAKRNGVSDRLTLRKADLLRGEIPTPEGGALLDAIVSNPPYIARQVIATLAPEVQKEPRIALDGGEDGLEFYRVLLSESGRVIKPQGWLMMEIGYDQGDALRSLCAALVSKESEVIVKRDYGGNDRVVLLRPNA